jgi:hypothetical protein
MRNYIEHMNLTVLFALTGIVSLLPAGLVRANNNSNLPFLPSPEMVSTVPSNGDLNPYGVAFISRNFQSGSGPLKAGDILVSNFNSNSGLQGTGTTIIRVAAADNSVSTFFATPSPTPGGPGTGLSTALVVLEKGLVIVGSVPSADGTIATSTPGSLLVIDSKGKLLSMISDPMINGPWDMTVDDHGDQAIAFISNVFAGTILRLELNVSSNGVKVAKRTVIASGYSHRGDPMAFAVGPTGLVYDSKHDVLFVASTEDNAVYQVNNAEATMKDHGTGTVIYSDNTHLHGPLGMAMAPNGHLLVANADVINSDPNQPSEIVEFTVMGKFVTQYSVDPAQGGSFGLAVQTDEDLATFAAVNDNVPTLLIFNLPLPE